MRTLQQNNAGSMAIEFALLAPIFVLLLLGVVCFAIAFSIQSGVQQLASEAARASVAGLNDAERAQIAQTFVASHVPSYPFVVPQRLTLSTSTTAAPAATFTVSLSYDLTDQVVSVFGNLFPAIPNRFHRDAVVMISTSL